MHPAFNSRRVKALVGSADRPGRLRLRPSKMSVALIFPNPHKMKVLLAMLGGHEVTWLFYERSVISFQVTSHVRSSGSGAESISGFTSTAG